MKETTREEMRQLLVRTQSLQLLAFDNGLNLYIWPNRDSNGEPWFTGCVEQGADFRIKEDSGVKFLHFQCYDIYSFEDNMESLDKIEEFINNYKK